MKRVPVFFLVFMMVWNVRGQEKFGISNSNYSPTNSIFLNPSSSVDNRTYIQMSLIGAQVFGKTNFGYLESFMYKDALNVETIQRSNSKTRQFFYADAYGQGPGLIVSNRIYGGGFFTRVRNVSDMRNVSYQLASAFLNENSFNPSQSKDLLGQDFKNARFTTMTWAEYGLNFGMMIKRQQDIIVALGGNLKYNTGINIYYANIVQFESFNNDNGIGVNHLEAIVRSNEAGWKTGRGWGLDVGITYKIMDDYIDKYYSNSKLSNCRYVDYKIKIGLSLLDLGYVRFRGATTRTDVSGSPGYFNPNNLDTSFTDVIRSNFKNSTVEGKPIFATLPTALSGQVDYNFDNGVYFNVSFIKNLIPARAVGVPGPDVLVICPRFEVLPFEVSLPVAFQKFRYPNLGFAFRFRSFVLGVDNIFPAFTPRNTSCVGIYFSLGISIFKNPACKTKRITVADCIKFATGKKRRSKSGSDFTTKRRKRK